MQRLSVSAGGLQSNLFSVYISRTVSAQIATRFFHTKETSQRKIETNFPYAVFLLLCLGGMIVEYDTGNVT